MVPGIDTLVAEIPILLRSNAYYSALSAALIVPDVCGALEAGNGQATGARYAAWFDEYVGDKYDDRFTGEDCYNYRCGVVHQLRGAGRRARYRKVLFLIPGQHMFHRNVMNDAFNIDLVTFCADITAGYQAWKDLKAQDPIVVRHTAEMMNYHPRGLAPYIVGIPVIG